MLILGMWILQDNAGDVPGFSMQKAKLFAQNSKLKWLQCDKGSDTGHFDGQGQHTSNHPTEMQKRKD